MLFRSIEIAAMLIPTTNADTRATVYPLVGGRVVATDQTPNRAWPNHLHRSAYGDGLSAIACVNPTWMWVV